MLEPDDEILELLSRPNWAPLPAAVVDLLAGEPLALALFAVFLTRARRKSTTTTTPRGQALGYGQLLVGRNELADKLKVSPKRIRTTTTRLFKVGLIAAPKGAKSGTVITIRHFELYARRTPAEGPSEGPDTGQQGANKGPTRGHKRDRENERPENVEEEEGLSKSGSKGEPTEIGYQLADELHASVAKQWPTSTTAKRWPPATRRAWATEFDKLVQLDGQTPADVKDAIRWLENQEGEFKVVVQSASALRKKWDKILAGRKRKPEPPPLPWLTPSKPLSEPQEHPDLGDEVSELW